MPDVSEQTAAACDMIARLVESTPGAEITRTQGTFDDPFRQQVLGRGEDREADVLEGTADDLRREAAAELEGLAHALVAVDEDHVAGTEDAKERVEVACCRVLIAGSFTALADQQGKGITSPVAPWVAPPSPDEVLRQALPAEGWTHEFDWDADGPDGTVAVFRRGSTVCMVVGRWRGGLPPAYAEAQGGVEDNDLPPWDPYYINVSCIDRAEPLRTHPHTIPTPPSNGRDVS